MTRWTWLGVLLGLIVAGGPILLWLLVWGASDDPRVFP